jgi:hypothetical protein
LPDQPCHRHFVAVRPPQPPPRNCPFCRIAMVASRSNSGIAIFDKFHCLQCDTVIRFDQNSGTDLIERGTMGADKPNT